MTRLSRRTVLASICFAGVAGLAYQATGWRKDVGAVAVLESSPITFGEWELFVLDARNGAILVIDPVRENVISRLEVGGNPTGLLQSANARLAAAVDASTRRLTVFRRRMEFERLTIDLDLVPSIVALSPDGTLFAVLDETSGELAFLSTEDGRELYRQADLRGANGLMFDKFGDALYVTRRDAPEIAAIDPKALGSRAPLVIPKADGLQALIAIRERGWGIALPPPAGEQDLHLVDLASRNIERSIQLPSAVSRVALDARGVWLFASSSSRPEVYRFSISGEYRATFAIDQVARDIILGGLGRWLGVVGADGRSLAFYDTKNNALRARHELPQQAAGMTYHLSSGKTLVALEDGEALWVKDEHSQVRSIALKGSAPALIAEAGSAICHA